MANDIPTIIFVVGAWHTDFHVQPIRPHLEQHGYRVVPITLATSIKSDPPPVLQDNVNEISRAIKTEVDAGRPFVLLGHSAAGHSITLAANDFLAGASAAQKSLFRHFVWIACFLDGVRLAPALTWASVIDDAAWVEVKDAHGTFFNDMSAVEAQPFIDALLANRAQWPPEFGDGYKQIERTYFLCRDDHAIPPEFQKLEAQEAGMRIVELDSGHVPFVSQPEVVARELHRVLAESA